MKLSAFSKNKKYYQTIVLSMLVFFLVVFLPLSFSVYNAVEKSISDNITRTNRTVLKNMEYSYDSFRTDAVNLCLATFFDYDVRSIMYNYMDESNSFNYMKKIQATTLSTNSSILSISVYNSVRGEVFTTESDREQAKKELLAFIAQQESLPTLTPIFRPITSWNQTEYVFSYFMYDSNGGGGKNESFIVINQKAEWFLDRTALAGDLSQADSRLYLVDRDGNICLPTGTPPASDQPLIRAYLHNNSGNYMGSKLVKQGEGAYIVTHLNLRNDNNAIVMVQSYEVVFADLVRLRAEFLLIGAAAFLIGFVLLFFLSKKIYNPIERLMSFVEETGGGHVPSKKGLGEFEYLQKIYLSASDLNQSLLVKQESDEELIKRYHLTSLCEDSGEKAVRDFLEFFSGHWLAVEVSHIYVAVLKYDMDEKNSTGVVEENPSLVMYGAHNIAQELFSAVCNVEVVLNGQGSLVLIANANDRNDDMEGLLKEKIHELNGYLEDIFHTRFSAAYAGSVGGLSEISGCYNRALAYLPYRCIHGIGAILSEENCAQNMDNPDPVYPSELENRLVDAIAKQDTEKTKDYVSDIQSAIGRLSYNNMLFSIMKLINAIDTALLRTAVSTKRAHMADMRGIISRVSFFQELPVFLLDYIESARSGNSLSVRTKKDQIFIDTVKEYIHKNYADVLLSSQQIGDYIGMSQKHIMKKFKDHTDIPLNKYIADVRMKKAEKLLIEKKMPIIKIAESVGYENESYFYKLFKNKHGCTPREYSERYGGDDTF